MKEFIISLSKQIQVSQEDAVVGALLSIGGFVLDVWFFEAGIPLGTTTLLWGLAGALASKWIKNRPFYQLRTMRHIDQLIKEGHLTQREARAVKRALFEIWIRTQVPGTVSVSDSLPEFASKALPAPQATDPSQ
jgi:hypothetical protein